MPRVENPSLVRAVRVLSFAVGLCGVAALAGCQSTSETGGWQPTADAEAQLKDPERLRLSFARMSEQRGDYQAARDAYRQASLQNPQSADAILGLARLDLLAGRIPAAERGFLQAYQIAPDNSLVIESLGQFYMTQGRFDEAVRHLSRGLDLTPGNSRMRHRLAVALAKQGNIAASEPHFAQSVGDAEADYNIGLILYEQGQVRQAEERFLSAVLKKPALAQAQHWLDVVRQELSTQTPGTQSPGTQSPGSGAGPAAGAQLASASRPASQHQSVQQLAVPQSQSVTRHSAATTGRESMSRGAQSTARANPYPVTRQQPAASGFPRGGGPVQSPAAAQALSAGSGPHSLKAQPAGSPRQPTGGLDLSVLNATQLEQFENSLSPTDRVRFRECLRTGTPFVR